ncbi:MAG: flagellar hook-basal body complex protein FliE [Thermodesulfobacteriota bacterium]
MADPIMPGVGNLGLPGPGSQSRVSQGAAGSPFEQILRQSVAAVQEKSDQAEAAVGDLVSGQTGTIHETMIAMEEASITFRLLTKVQGKVVSAYQEIMRLPL